MMNKIDCEDLNRWQTVKRGRYGAAPIKILQGKKNPPQTKDCITQVSISKYEENGKYI